MISLRVLLPILISTLILLASHLLQPPNLPRPKIFVIGLSKTGTTSIGDALSHLGYRRLGWGDIRSRHLVHTFANGKFQPHVSITKYYDAFEDLPWCSLYREMAELYPSAKFILSLRKDEETWLRSVKTHFGRGRWLPYNYFYGADVYDGSTEEIIRESYRKHTRAVREFFQDKPDRFVELNIDAGSEANWEALCTVAMCPGGVPPAVAFPRSNTAASWSSSVVFGGVGWFWRYIITRIEERAAILYYGDGSEWMKAGLRAYWRVHDAVETVCMAAYFGVLPLFR